MFVREKQLNDMIHSLTSNLIFSTIFSKDTDLGQLSQETEEVTNDNAPSEVKKPLPYSSVVYFQNNGCIFCTGVLIAPKFVFTDGYCGGQVLSLSEVYVIA